MRYETRVSVAVSAGLLLAACRGGASLPVEVASLRESLPQMESAAKAWRPDAYLDDAEISVRVRNSTGRRVSAEFNSPSTEFESLGVEVLADGSVRVERVPHTVPVRQVEPISTDDWKLDSAEALEVALDEEGRTFLGAHIDSHCSFLKLERNIGEPGEPVVWRLVLIDCLSFESLPDRYVDPVSGVTWIED
jgi:hypothetical protein